MFQRRQTKNHCLPVLPLSRYNQDMGKLLIIAGVFLVLFGLLFTYWDKIPLLGRLPGDILVERGNFKFFFPLATSILLSLILTVILNLVFRIFR